MINRIIFSHYKINTPPSDVNMENVQNIKVSDGYVHQFTNMYPCDFKEYFTYCKELPYV